MILTDNDILELLSLSVIFPYCETRQHKNTSFGLSSCGYDLTLSDSFGVMRETHADDIVSAAEATPEGMFDITKSPTFLLKPKEFMLAAAVEHIKMPDNLCGFVMDKSSLARKGISLLNTFIEPGWHGNITLEIFNMSNKTILFEAGMGICQLVFAKTTGVCATPYGAKKMPKYQGQVGVQCSL
jgi:dCTP deaminase